LANSNKECIACAEEIKSQAKLCRFCGTLQEDKEFLKATKASKKTNTTKQPRKVPTTKPHTNCLVCRKALKKEEVSVCNNCKYIFLSKRDLDLLRTGVHVEVCPLCKKELYSPEISEECISCENKNSRTSSIWTSWWVQVILVVAVLINPYLETFSSPASLFLTTGGQLFSTNAFLALILWVVSLALGEKHKNYQKVKSWTISTLLFVPIGLALMFLGFLFAI